MWNGFSVSTIAIAFGWIDFSFVACQHSRWRGDRMRTARQPRQRTYGKIVLMESHSQIRTESFRSVGCRHSSNQYPFLIFHRQTNAVNSVWISFAIFFIGTLHLTHTDQARSDAECPPTGEMRIIRFDISSQNICKSSGARAFPFFFFHLTFQSVYLFIYIYMIFRSIIRLSGCRRRSASRMHSADIRPFICRNRIHLRAARLTEMKP